MKERKISILSVEDNLDDTDLLRRTLSKSSLNCTLKDTTSQDELEKMDLSEFDLIITDYQLGSFTGLDVVKFVRKTDPIKPIIVLSGTVGDELAVDLLHAGANDFVLKSSLKKVPVAIQKALSVADISIEKNRFQKELIEKNLILDTVFDAFQNLIFLKDASGKYVKVNQAFCDFVKKRPKEIIGRTDEIFNSKHWSLVIKENEKYPLLTGNNSSFEIDIDSMNGGGRRVFEIHLYPLLDGKNVSGIIGECKDITKQRLLIEETEKAQSVLLQAEKLTKAGSFELDTDLDILQCSMNFKRMLNLRIDGNTISLRKFTEIAKAEDRQLMVSGIHEALENKEEYYLQHRFTVGEETAYFNVFLKPDYSRSDKNIFYGTLVDVTTEQENHMYTVNQQEADRREISRELHDNLGQKLTAASMFISKMSDSQPDNKDFIKVKEITREAIDDLRYLMNTVSSKSVLEHSLDFAVNKLAEYIPDDIDVQLEMDFNEEELSQYVKSQLYRVIQEVINNALKYSQASKISIDLHQYEQLLDLTIKDNGVGFNIEEGMKGHGLQNISHRVRRLNGLIKINSKDKKGTSVWVRVPVK